MIMLPMTLSDLEPSQITPISTFPVSFHIFIMDEHRNFKLGTLLDHGKFHSTDDKPSPKDAWLPHVTHFKFVTALNYLKNG